MCNRKHELAFRTFINPNVSAACANDENEVRFETVGVPYCGVPFFVAGLKILQCQSYRVRGGRKKKEIKIEVGGEYQFLNV